MNVCFLASACAVYLQSACGKCKCILACTCAPLQRWTWPCVRVRVQWCAGIIHTFAPVRSHVSSTSRIRVTPALITFCLSADAISRLNPIRFHINKQNSFNTCYVLHTNLPRCLPSILCCSCCQPCARNLKLGIVPSRSRHPPWFATDSSCCDTHSVQHLIRLFAS